MYNTGLAVDSYLLPTTKSRETKTRTKIKNPAPLSFSYCPEFKNPWSFASPRHKWGEEIAFENGRISDFQGLVTLTLDQVILHTVMHHSSTSTYIPNFIEIEETFCGRTDGRTDVYGWTFETHFIRSTRLNTVDLKTLKTLKLLSVTVNELHKHSQND